MKKPFLTGMGVGIVMAGAAVCVLWLLRSGADTKAADPRTATPSDTIESLFDAMRGNAPVSNTSESTMPQETTVNVLPEPMVQAGKHEPLSFRRRRGDIAVNEEEIWRREHSEEIFDALARRGITWIRAHFFKGGGLAFEADEIDLTRKLVRMCHDRNIKVQLYTQFGTLQYETFLAECPDMRDWCCVDDSGQPIFIRYGHQDFRYRPCLTREGYWDYLRRVLELGIKIGGDGFGFDNVESPMEGKACHCPQCRAAFVAFLKQRYPSDAERVERFGMTVLDHVLPPRYNAFNTPVGQRVIRDPVHQEWIWFRCEQMRKRFEEIYRFVKRRKPEMMIEYNVYPPAGKNAYYWQGIDMHALAPFMDMFYNERAPHDPQFDPAGLVWHRQHAFKLAAATGCRVICGSGGRDAAQRKLMFAEKLACNGGHLTRIGRPIDVAEGAFPEADAFIAFRNAHPELFEGAESAAEVALFESAESLAFNCEGPHLAEIQTMAALIAGRVPWDLIVDLETATLARHTVVVLPEVECLSAEQAARLVDFVRHGGGLVFTGETGRYDLWRRSWPRPALSALLEKAERKEGDVCRGALGDGRFVRLDSLRPPELLSPNPGAPFFSRDELYIQPAHWRLPTNWKQLICSIDWAGESRLSLRVKGPDGVAVEPRRLPDGRLVVHLMDYQLGRTAKDLEVQLATPVRSARLWSPWRKSPVSLSVQTDGGISRVAIPSLQCYAIVEILS